jgi:preprotein translocase subunit YajC
MQGSPSWAPTLFMYAAFAAIFYFILWRPQAAQRKRHESLIAQLKRGDEVVTSGGVVGKVERIAEANAGKPGMEDRITISSDTSRLVVERRAITRVASSTASAATPAS